MDTRWKKSTCAISFLCFVLGVSLLLSGGVLAFANRDRWRGAADALKSDYQETAAFRDNISTELGYLLEQAVPHGENVVVSTLIGRNLLYWVDRGGQITRGNAGGWMGSPEELPEGYNFLLVFDGERVTVWKDGQQLDVYGDGFYRPERGGWYVPGYQNLTAADFYDWRYPHSEAAGSPSAAFATPAPSPGTAAAGAAGSLPASVSNPFKGVRICMAAAADPVYYPNSDGGRNPLYYLVQHQKGVRIFLLIYALVPAVGLALFVFYLVRRKAKAQADRGVAWVCGKIWLEFKLLLLIPLVWLSWHSFMAAFSYAFYRWDYVMAFFALPCLWCWYLYVNDLRYNGAEFFRNSLCAWCARLFRRAGLRYPVQRRLARRANWQFIAGIPFVAASALLGVVLLAAFGFRGAPYFLFLMVLAMAGLALIGAQARFLYRQHADIADLGRLLDRIQAVRDGRTDAALPLSDDSDLRDAAEALDNIQAGMREAVERQLRSERMKVELIANVSHDLKTPLTSIISYAELLSREENLPDHVADYIRILNTKAVRLKSMVQEVFEVSKAASGDLPVHLEALDLAKLLRQTLADMDEAVSGSSLTFRVQLPQEPAFIRADGDRLYRVFQNLIQNALQYSLEGSRVFLTLRAEGARAVVQVQNTSREELPEGVDFTARFVRGDASRTDGGSGLGLSIARTFTEACGGAFQVEVRADLFTATVAFPLTDLRPPDPAEP